MARRPVPDNVKKMRGTGKPSRTVDQVVTFESYEAPPPAPDYLNVWARDYWDHITPILIKHNNLTVADLGALEVLCALQGLFKQHCIAGTAISAATITQLRQYQAEFGLTPSSRNRATHSAKAGNPFANNGAKP